MTRSTRLLRTAVATPLAALLLALSVAVPVMEVADQAHAPVVESEHQPDSCPKPHDHTVCTQVGANHAAPGTGAGERSVGNSTDSRTSLHVEDAPSSRALRTRAARAPPRI